MDKLQDVFKPAQWGETIDFTDYDDLGDLWEWTPVADQPQDGMVTITKVDGFIHSVGSAWGGYADSGWPQKEWPLLPSPDEINAQSKPRGAAISALNRAGFRLDEYGTMKVEIVDVAGIQMIVAKKYDYRVMFGAYTSDLDKARYMLDCAEVLNPWADKVNWGKE